MRPALTALLLALLLGAQAQAKARVSEAQARERFVECLKKAGEARGATCVGPLPGYPQPVAVLVPRGYQAGVQADLIFISTVTTTARHGRWLPRAASLVERLATSNRNIW